MSTKKTKPLFGKDELKRQSIRWSQTNWGGAGGETAHCAVIDPVGFGLPGGRLVGIVTRKRRLPAAE